MKNKILIAIEPHPKAVHAEVEKSGPVLLIADFRQISISLIY
jgi:hypothetical protein